MGEPTEKFNNNTNRILLSGSIATAQILLIVTDTMLSHAYALNIVSSWGSPGSGNGQFNNPSGMDFDFKGHLYVVDTGNNPYKSLMPQMESSLQLGVLLALAQESSIAQ